MSLSPPTEFSSGGPVIAHLTEWLFPWADIHKIFYVGATFSVYWWLHFCTVVASKGTLLISCFIIFSMVTSFYTFTSYSISLHISVSQGFVIFVNSLRRCLYFVSSLLSSMLLVINWFFICVPTVYTSSLLSHLFLPPSQHRQVSFQCQ